MKECQAVKKDGSKCNANGAHIFMVWALGMVAYPQDKLPALYASHGWKLQAINVCGAHHRVLIGGKPINIIPITGINQTSVQEVPTQPKEGIMKYRCDWCKDTGKDPVLWDACKCVSDVETTSPATKAQLDYIKGLLAKVEFEVKISDDTKAEASKSIDLLKEILNLKKVMDDCGISPEREVKIKTKLKEGANKVWVKAQINRIVSDDLVSKIQKVMKVDLSWSDYKVETIGLLKAILTMVNSIKAKKAMLTSEQVEYLREQINGKPTTGWVLAKIDKLSKLS